MPQIAELQPHPVLPAESSYQASQERTVINVLPLVEGGDIDLACEQVGFAKGLQPFSSDEFPDSAEATYIPYQGNPGVDSCEFQVADFLVDDMDPHAKAEAIVANIGKVVVEPSAPNVIRFTAQDGGVHQVASLKPEVLLNWLASKGYKPEPNEEGPKTNDQTFTFSFNDVKPAAEVAVSAEADVAPNTETGPSTDLLPLPDVPAKKAPVISPSLRFVMPQEAAKAVMNDMPTRPKMAPVSPDNSSQGAEKQAKPLPVSEEYLAIRHIVGLVSAEKLANRFGLAPETVSNAIADTMNNERMLQALPTTLRAERNVVGFNKTTSFVIRAAMREVQLTNPDIDELRLSNTPEARRQLMNLAALKHHNVRANEAELLTKASSLLSETPIPEPIQVLTPYDTGHFEPVELEEVLQRPPLPTRSETVMLGINKAARAIRRGLSGIYKALRQKVA